MIRVSITETGFLAMINKAREWDNKTYKQILQWFADPTIGLPTFYSICGDEVDNEAIEYWTHLYGIKGTTGGIEPDIIAGPAFPIAADLIKTAVKELHELHFLIKGGDRYVLRQGSKPGQIVLCKDEWGSRVYTDVEFYQSFYEKTWYILGGVIPRQAAEIEINFQDIQEFYL